MKHYASVCEIRNCGKTAQHPMISILEYPTVEPHLIPNSSRHGTLVHLCPDHKKEFGIKKEE